MRRRDLASMLLALTACGARSTLEAGDEASESAGGAGTAGQGSGAAGGSGGAPLICDALTIGLGPTALPSPDPSLHSLRPDLVGLEDDRLALITTLAPVESPAPGPLGVAHQVVAPWTGGSLETSEPEIVTAQGGRSVVATETGRVGLYALGLSPAGPGPGSMRVARTVDPTVSYLPEIGGIAIDDEVPSRPELLVEMSEGLLFGWARRLVGDTYLLGLARVDQELEEIAAPSSGCAVGELETRAVATEGGAVMATTSGRAADTCFNDDGIIGPPRFLQTGFVEGQTLAFAVEEDEEMAEPIGYLDLVAVPGGAWMIWQTDGSTSEVSPPVFARRLDAAGAFTGSAVEVVPPGHLPPFGAAAFGNGFAFVYIDAVDPGPPTLVARIHDGEGALLAEGSAALSLGGFGDRFAVRASPTTDALLLAWSRGPTPITTQLLRFDCLP